MKNGKFVFLCILLGLSSAYASGFRNYQQGARATALGGAFIARADDPSAIFYNPAGISFAAANTFSIGTTLVNPLSSFTGPLTLDKNIYTETKSNFYSPSTLYMIFPVFKNVNFGFGLYSPFSYGVEWPENWVGRFIATNTEYKSLSLNPVLSWKPFRFISVGAGLDLMYGAFIYENGVVFTPRELSGTGRLSGDAYGLGFNAGIQVEPLNGLKLGATYRSSRKLDFREAEKSFHFPRTDNAYTNAEVAFVFQSIDASTSFSLPAEYGFGIAYEIFNNLILEADQVFTDWEIYDAYLVTLDLEGAENAPLTFMRFYQNTQSQRFGLEYQVIADLSLRVTACQLEKPNLTQNFHTGQADFTRYVAIGNSISSGFQSGALTAEHQELSYPNLLASQAGVEVFTQPLLAYPGLGQYTIADAGILELIALSPLTIIPAQYSEYPEFDPDNPYLTGEIAGQIQPYHNLAIPGLLLADAFYNTISENSFSQTLFIDTILRNKDKAEEDQKTVWQQARELDPTFITCWIGNNDYLAFALSGGENGDILTTHEDFEFLYSQLIDSLGKNGAQILTFTLPGLRSLPYFTTIQPYIPDSLTGLPLTDENGDKIPLLGVDPENDLMLLTAQFALANKKGIPSWYGGNDEPMPDEVVLDAAELQKVDAAVEAFNLAIYSISAERNIPVFDTHDFLLFLSDGGYDVVGYTFNGEYLSGGFYSLDGLHPTDAGNVLLANRLISFINEEYAASIPLINIVDYIGK